MKPGLMQSTPLLISSILKFAATVHGRRDIASRLIDEPIWRALRVLVLKGMKGSRDGRKQKARFDGGLFWFCACRARWGEDRVEHNAR